MIAATWETIAWGFSKRKAASGRARYASKSKEILYENHHYSIKNCSVRCSGFVH